MIEFNCNIRLQPDAYGFMKVQCYYRKKTFG